MRKRKWLRRVMLLVILILATSAGLSRALRTSAARSYLTAHLIASFGRPVEVDRFDFSLLDGARLEAHSVSVAEDPHFGNEYFLRAETLTAGLRWLPLLSGRFEFGSLSLLRPSLNLVRDADGHWNIERWLPPSATSASRPGFVGPLAAASRGVQAARLNRIEVDSGRINFKQRDDKSPFALLDVSGSVEQDSSGRWQLDLEARPMRAGVELQDIGTLRLRGTIAGTSARLQPADLNLTWRAASLADALRLARQVDYGMRGTLSVDLEARIAPPAPASPEAAQSSAAQWTISGVARLTGIHGWKLPGRDADPAANVSLDASWRLGERRAQVQKLLVEMAGSHVQGTGDLDWGHGFQPQLHIETSSISLSDILSCYRSLHTDVAEDLRVQGALGLDVTLGGWPVQLQQGAIAGAGATLTGASLPAPLQIGPMNASVSHGGLDFAPTTVSFSPNSLGDDAANIGTVASPGAYILRGSVLPEANGAIHWPPNWNLSIEGATPRAQDWLVLSETLAQPLNTGWTAAGGVAIKMRGAHRTGAPANVWLGTMDFRGLTVSPDQVNQAVRLPQTHIEFTPQQQTITLSAAEALGAAWRGTISRKISDKQWSFDLSANHLDAAELDRWLGPRARPGFLARFTSLGAADANAGPAGDAAVARMFARGHLKVGEIVVAPLRFEQFDGDVELDGRAISVRKAQADFFGGKVAGTFDARLLADPSYTFQGRFDRVNLALLGGGSVLLNNRIAGTASATLTLAAHGVGRENLIGLMEGNGTLDVRNAALPGLDFKVAFPGDQQDPSLNAFASVQGAFRIQTKGIDLTNFVLDHSRGRLQAEGRIDFSHALDLRIRPSIFQAATLPAAASPQVFLLTGTIENPRLALPNSAPAPIAKSGTRVR